MLKVERRGEMAVTEESYVKMLSLSERLLSDQEACILRFVEVGVKGVQRGRQQL